MANADGRINALIAGMTLEEKLGQLNLAGGGGDIPTGVAVNTDTDAKMDKGLVGGIFNLLKQDNIINAQKRAMQNGQPILFAADVIHGYRTPVFPLPLGLANSWDPAMVQETARIAGLQAAAEGIRHVYSPMIDITRDARWGRVAEGFGEDPHLVSAFAVAMVRGYQGVDLKSPDSVAACMKHFIAYGAAKGGLDYAPAEISPAEMHDVYLKPFIAATKAGALSMMAAFNEVNGTPMHAHGKLISVIRNIAPDMVVVSDYTGINEMTGHGIGDGAEVAARALEAGIDQDMIGELFLATLPQSLADGRVTMAQIDAACRRVLLLKEKMGLLDDPFNGLTPENFAAVKAREPEYRAFARRTVARSGVLLNNADNILPLKKSGTIAVIGPLADSRENMPGTWAVAGDMTQCSTVLEGITEVAGAAATILYARGANITNHVEKARRYNIFGDTAFIDPRSPAEMIAEAVAIANKADTIVLVVGEAKEASGEAASVTDIGLPQSQIRLIRAVIATGKPVALVVMSGRPLSLENILMDEDDLALGAEDTNVQKIPGTILWMPFGGTETGGGLADVLFGDYNPSGKLAMTFPRQVGQCPVHYAQKMSGRNMDPAKEWKKFKLRYLDRKNTPLFEFGHGLSYTSFEYGPVTVDKDRLSSGDTLKAHALVTNTGKREGEEIVQMYLTDPVARRTRPVRELKGFQKILLQPGESRAVEFSLTTEDLEFSVADHIADTRKIWEAGDFIIQIGPSCSRGGKAKVFWDKPQQAPGPV